MPTSGGIKKISAKIQNSFEDWIEGYLEVIASEDRVQVGNVSVDRYQLLQAIGVTDEDLNILRGVKDGTTSK